MLLTTKNLTQLIVPGINETPAGFPSFMKDTIRIPGCTLIQK